MVVKKTKNSKEEMLKKKKSKEVDAVYEEKIKTNYKEVDECFEEKDFVFDEDEDSILDDSNEENGTRKSYFFPRVLACLIDITIVSLVLYLILAILPQNENYSKYLEEYQVVQTQYAEQKISAEEYINKSADVVYDVDRNNVMPMIIECCLLLCYFGIFQYYNNGQTIGKKLMKIKVVSSDGEKVSMNQLVIRSLIIQSILAEMIIIQLVLFIGRDYYFYGTNIVQIIQMVITVVSVFMILYSKSGKGLHDRLAKTDVVMID